MKHRLLFETSYHYDGAAPGIVVPVTLIVGSAEVVVFTKLDTGADYCIFEHRYGALIGLNVESGPLRRFRTAAGSFGAFEHELTIRTLGFSFTAVVYFAQDEGFQGNVLGRTGWLDRVRLGIVDYEQTLYLSPYED